MNNLQNNQLNNNRDYDYEIDLSEFFHMLWDKIFYIGATTSIFLLISITYALMLPNVYKSEALMMPMEKDAGMSGMLEQYGGIASLAGISLPSESASKSQEAIARIQSFKFFSDHFLPNIMLENLLAVKRWNPEGNTLAYNKSDFNSESRQWVRKVRPPKSTIPSSQEAYEKYREILMVSEDKKTQFVALSVEHESPFIAQQWAELIIDQIDQSMRAQDRETATKSIEYLNSLAPTINYEEIKKALSSLQHGQMKRLMMVEANEDYIFKMLDSPVAPEMKSEPRRSLIVILGTILGAMLSIFGVIAFDYFKKTTQHNKSSV